MLLAVHRLKVETVGVVDESGEGRVYPEVDQALWVRLHDCLQE